MITENKLWSELWLCGDLARFAPGHEYHPYYDQNNADGFRGRNRFIELR